MTWLATRRMFVVERYIFREAYPNGVIVRLVPPRERSTPEKFEAVRRRATER